MSEDRLSEGHGRLLLKCFCCGLIGRRNRGRGSFQQGAFEDGSRSFTGAPGFRPGR